MPSQFPTLATSHTQATLLTSDPDGVFVPVEGPQSLRLPSTFNHGDGIVVRQVDGIRPRKTTALTDTALKGLKPQVKAYKVTDGAGMYVVVSPSGTKTFRFDYGIHYGRYRQPSPEAPHRHTMFNRVCRAVTFLIEWLMQPVRAAKNVRQRLLFRALRSRFFLLVAVLSAMPLLFNSSVATYKAAQSPVANTSPWLLWAVAVSSWVLFLLTVLHQHWLLRNRKRDGESVV